MNLAEILANGARERTALVLPDGSRRTYAELEHDAARAASILRRRGVRPGDRVAVRLPNGRDVVAALFGTWLLGAVAVPLNILLAAPEVDARLRAAGPAAVVDGPLDLDGAAPAAGGEPLGPGAPAVILFTSGTSGTAKGAVLTHDGIAAAAEHAARVLELGESDVVLGTAPFSHVLGLSTVVVGTLSRGATLAAAPRFDAADTLRYLAATGTTVLPAVPTMCVALMEAAAAAAALPPLRVAHVGGAPLAPEVARRFELVFSAPVCEGYGLTEMSGVATAYSTSDNRKPGSVGRPLGATEVRIRDVGDGLGEVQFRGPSVFAGYLDDPAATAAAVSEDGWLATGDLGYLDDEGDLFLVDRTKDLIIRGGYNVAPREVEEALVLHPAVREAAVLAIPDARLGQEVGAVVVLREGASVTADELVAWTKERVAAYKYPRHISFADTLPKGPTGKILKRAIDVGAVFGAHTISRPV